MMNVEVWGSGYPGGVRIFVATVTPVVKGVHRIKRPRREREF